MLNKDTIKNAIVLLRNKSILEKINAIIFLTYKPIYSSSEICLADNSLFGEFIDEIKEAKFCKIGFDSCMISYLTQIDEYIKTETIDFCEAARFSAFISEESIMYPCSFMCHMTSIGIDLRKTSIQDAWINGRIFQQTREYLNTPCVQKYPIDKCESCEKYHFCHGGCQFFDINKCREDHYQNG